VIASVQGHALGGGCELAMFCDLTIAAEDAQFGEPEVLFSQVGPAVLMPFIIGHKRARELIYFGDRIDAKRALVGIPGLPPRLVDMPPGCSFAPRCPYAFDRCRRETPALQAIVPGERVACHLYPEHTTLPPRPAVAKEATH